jgi:hypothetical protein
MNKIFASLPDLILGIVLFSVFEVPKILTMVTFKYLFQFETGNQEKFWARSESAEPVIGGSVTAYLTFDDAINNTHSGTAIVAKV